MWALKFVALARHRGTVLLGILSAQLDILSAQPRS